MERGPAGRRRSDEEMKRENDWLPLSPSPKNLFPSPSFQDLNSQPSVSAARARVHVWPRISHNQSRISVETRFVNTVSVGRLKQWRLFGPRGDPRVWNADNFDRVVRCRVATERSAWISSESEILVQPLRPDAPNGTLSVYCSKCPACHWAWRVLIQYPFPWCCIIDINS